ncbi:MAG: biotin/lipoate--protein ligase family protein [Hyphomicrobiaceae bacterium]|nr:biotin/lipoate--protein ligase family protein [Hyphomicrobiaceae bacterium]
MRCEPGVAMLIVEPDLPPLLTGHAVLPPDSPFAAACDGAADGRLGAGDFTYATRADIAAAALVLEPEVSAGTARQMVPLLFVAVAQSLGAQMPPKTSILLRWPDIILVNGAAAGRLSYAMAEHDGVAPPDWLVIGAELQVASPFSSADEPGTAVHRTSLADEGGGDLAAVDVLSSLAAHLLANIDMWRDEPFAQLADECIGRLEGYDRAVGIADGETLIEGRILGLSEACGLIVKATDGRIRELALPDRLPSTSARVVRGGSDTS